MLSNRLQMIFILSLFGLGLAACGDSDTSSSDKAQSISSDKAQSISQGTMSDGSLEAYDPDVPSMVVEDNGVISEEEIYKAWPQ